ncbi:MAG: chemotaxis protein CheD [Nitrospirae bacterium]|nr:chemotaxis protein CheD [Nitrospirota bacterium]
MKIINIGVGELAVSTEPAVFKTILGSCVGVALYANQERLGGLIHIFLPRMPRMNNQDGNRAKYADTGIPLLITTIENRYGVAKNKLVAKIAGGANMFPFKKITSPLLDIGSNNITIVKETLDRLRIPIIEEDVGATYGRRIEFHLDTGKFIIFSANMQGVLK